MDIDWQTFLNDNANHMHAQFLEVFCTCVRKYVLSKRSNKNRLWTRYMETSVYEKYRNYTKYRNQVKCLLRNSRKATEKSIADDAKANPEVFWEYVNSKREKRTLYIRFFGRLHQQSTSEPTGKLLVLSNKKGIQGYCNNRRKCA